MLFKNERGFADLVCSNRLLRRAVVAEIKTHKITSADIGQLQIYVSYYGRCRKLDDESPVVGVLPCADKNGAVVKMTLPADNATILASKCQLYRLTELGNSKFRERTWPS
jgi:hypothetical protein